MSRLPTSRFPPPVLFQPPSAPSKSAVPFRPSASSPVLYDSDSYDEDGGSFTLLPSPEHYLSASGDSPRPQPPMRKSATQPVIYDEEEDLVSPSQSYTTMSPSASLEHLPPPVASERQTDSADAAPLPDGSKSRVQSSRNNRVQHRNALRLDLMDADEDESVNEEEEDSGAQQKQRQRDVAHTNPVQPGGQSKRSSAVLFNPPVAALPASSSSTSILSSITTSTYATTSPVPVPVRSAAATHQLSASTSDMSLPSASYDEYNDGMLSGHSLNDSPTHQFGRTRRSTRDEYDDEDEGAYGHSADVIELEDDERERESSGSAGKIIQRGARAQSATHAVAASLTERRSTPSPQLVPLLSSVPSTLHPVSSASSISPYPATSPALLTSSSVPIIHHSRPARSVLPITARPASIGSVDDEGEDGDDEHDDQHNEERDDTSSAIISLPASTQDKHETMRSFGGVASSPLRTLTSSYSIQAPSLSHTASTNSSSSISSSSSSSSHVSAITELPTSPTSGAEDVEAEDYNDDNVVIVTSPHHSHSPSRAPQQQSAPATDEEDESEPSFQLQLEEELSERQPKPPTPVMLPTAPATPQRRPSHVSIVAGEEDVFAEAKSRREKLIAGKAARLVKKSRHERWEKDSSVRRDSQRLSTATKVSMRSNSRNQSDSSASSSGSSSNSSGAERSEGDSREAEDGGERVRGVNSRSSNRLSPAPHASVTPPSPARPPLSQPNSRSSSPVKVAHRQQHQHDGPNHSVQPMQQQQQQQLLSQHDGAGPAWRRTSAKQREERRPSDNSRESPPLPPSHPLPLTRTGSHSSRTRQKKKRGSSEDDIRVADLDFKEKIGEGAYGDVYRGYLWGQEVAIKQIRLDGGKEEAEEETVREFRREMKIMKHLRHPNVVEFLGACMSEQSLCLLTEYMPNGSLEDHLTRLKREGKRMRESRVVSLSLDVVKGLNWLHHKGIIHRDLKSANILLDAAGRAKLADFGLSHVRRRRDDSMDGHHGVAGTPSYIAPEVLMGREYGVKADVYSLGVLVNEALATVAPYDDTPLAHLDLPSFEAAVLAGGRPKLADCHNAALTQLVVDCWQIDADSRPSVESIMKTLDRIDRDIHTEQQQQLIQHVTEASAASPSSSSSSIDDLPTPLRSLLANDYARLYQMQAALAEQERQLQARSAAMASEKAAREEEHKQWAEIRERHRREEQDHKRQVTQP